MKNSIIIFTLILGIGVNAQKFRAIAINPETYIIQEDKTQYVPNNSIEYIYEVVDTFRVMDLNNKKIHSASDYGFDPLALYFCTKEYWAEHNSFSKEQYSFSIPVIKYDKVTKIYSRREGELIILRQEVVKTNPVKQNTLYYLLFFLPAIILSVLIIGKIRIRGRDKVLFLNLFLVSVIFNTGFFITGIVIFAIILFPFNLFFYLKLNKN